MLCKSLDPKEEFVYKTACPWSGACKLRARMHVPAIPPRAWHGVSRVKKKANALAARRLDHGG